MREATDLALLDRVEADQENLRAALVESRSGETALELRIASAMGWFSYFRGNVREGGDALDAALARADDDTPPELYLDALDRRAWLLYWQGDLAEARAATERALQIAHELADARRISVLLSQLGLLARRDGDLAGARNLCEEALETARSAGDRQSEYRVMLNLGDLELYEENFQRARSYFERASVLATEHGDAATAGVGVWNAAAAYLHDGNVATADRQFAQALTKFRDLKWDEGIAYGLEGLAAAAARKGEAERAAQLFGAAGALFEETGMTFEPFEQAMHDRTQQILQEALGEERFRALASEGAALGVETADAHSKA